MCCLFDVKLAVLKSLTTEQEYKTQEVICCVRVKQLAI